MSTIRAARIQAKAIAILRGDDTQTADSVIQSLQTEVSMPSKLRCIPPLRLIHHARQQYGHQALIGAGTVLDGAQVQQPVLP